jgi:hypothetical protein
VEEKTKVVDSLRGEVERLRSRVSELEDSAGDLKRIQQRLGRSEESERTMRRRFASLLEVGLELARQANQEDLCLLAVEQGREKLGFDRLGIWFRMEEPNIMRGTYGVDEKGEVQDERHLRMHIDANTPEGRIIMGREPFVLVGEAPLLNALGDPVDRASQIMAALWDGEHVIGYLSADNRVNQQPLEEAQIELLRLFGAVVGFFFSRLCIQIERLGLIAQLQDALANIKTLQGLIPICANCKKIRDDKGYWSQIEVYLTKHSDADFSHGICPDCLRTLYPDLAGSSEGETDG